MGLSPQRRAERLLLLEALAAETGWRRLGEGAVVAPGFDPAAAGVGSLVFDIDGVLLDVHRSFREVIPQSVNYYLEVILHEDGRAPLMRSEDVHAWKTAGGFNNDWDVAEGALMLALWWSRHPETAPPLAGLVEALAADGGGIEAARRILRRKAGSKEADGIVRDIDRSGLERIFKELYVGGARFREVFGEEPRFFRGTGGMEREQPLTGGPAWEAARRYPLGILTGRIPQEARLAAERLGLEEILDTPRIVTDDGRFPTKPDPGGLVHLAGTLPERPLYYFGDNRDDLTALLGARRVMADDRLYFVYCLSGSTDRDTLRWFAGSGTVVAAVELTDALEALPL
jgi:HAD superfamily phosphatase